MLQHYLATNQCYERIILIDSGNSLISFIRSDGSLPWHCLRSHSIKFLEDLAVIWRRLHHVMRGYKVKSSQISPRRWGRRRSILSLRLLDQQVTASKANLQVAEPKKFHLQPNIWLKSEVWAYQRRNNSRNFPFWCAYGPSGPSFLNFYLTIRNKSQSSVYSWECRSNRIAPVHPFDRLLGPNCQSNQLCHCSNIIRIFRTS